MPQTFYHEGSRALQERFDTRRLADRLVEVTVRHEFSDHDRAFIESRDMFFLATSDEQGHPDCSYKGGDRGFVRVLDPHTLAFPNYDGNGMYRSMGNLSRNPHVGLLFIDFEHASRMRVNGTARIEPSDPLLAEFPEAQFIVRVTPTDVFPNCPRYIHRYQKVVASEFVPREGCATPVPGWKRAPWAADVLAKNDPARKTGTSVPLRKK